MPDSVFAAEERTLRVDPDNVLSQQPAAFLNAAQKAQAERLMAYFENGVPDPQYGFCGALGDGRGLTCGRAGFTTANGDWLRLIEDYTDRAPGNALAPFLPRLAQLAAASSASIAGLSAMPEAVAASAGDPVFRTLQDQHQDIDSYWPAMAQADRLGAATALTRAVLYDTLLQHGNGADPDGTRALVAAANARAGGTPAGGIAETAWLETFLDVREADLLHPAATATTKEWAASTDRIAVFRALLTAGDTDLGGALHVHTRDYDIDMIPAGPGAVPAGGAPTVAVFHGAQADYAVAGNASGGIAVTDSATGRDGTAVLTNAEALRFTDQTVLVVNQDGAVIARLYAAALGRHPDLPGLQAWTATYTGTLTAAERADAASGNSQALAGHKLAASGQTIAWSFSHAPEFTQKYGTLNDGAFLSQMYQNVLGRAPDSAGFDAWAGAMAGGLSHEQVLASFATSAENRAHTAGWIFVI